MSLARDGYLKLPYDPSVAAWAEAACDLATKLTRDAALRKRNLRHGETWFVGVDALPNDHAGALGDVLLRGPWEPLVPELPLHRAQLSVIYPGYPKRDPKESLANHRFRARRFAAHVDGLLPEGPARRRFAREYHAYVLGIPLNICTEAPTVVWPGSHLAMGDMLREALLAAQDPGAVDLTETYQSARRAVFEVSNPVPLRAAPGESFLIHRHALHGTAPWDGPANATGRMVAFFRPEFADISAWLAR